VSAIPFPLLIVKLMNKKTKTYDQWLEFLDDHMSWRKSNNTRLVGFKYHEDEFKGEIITFYFDTYDLSPETGQRIPSTWSISEGDVDSAEAFSWLVGEISNRYEDEWRW